MQDLLLFRLNDDVVVLETIQTDEDYFYTVTGKIVHVSLVGITMYALGMRDPGGSRLLGEVVFFPWTSVRSITKSTND